jgi:hypothetical protein
MVLEGIGKDDISSNNGLIFDEISGTRRSLRDTKRVDYSYAQILQEETSILISRIYPSPNSKHWKWPVGRGKSTLPGANYGLFALRDIKPGEYICTYERYQIHLHKYLS